MLWRGLREDKDLAYALSAYEHSLRDIYAEYIAHQYGLDRTVDYRSDVVAALLVASVSLANDKWVEAPTAIDLGVELSSSLEVAEAGARAILDEKA